MRMLAAALSVLACLLATAAPAYAERIEGRGWEFDLPPGFVEALSMEGGGKFNVSSRFGTLPIEGVPEIKAYVSGDPNDPKGVLIVSRIDMRESVLTTDEMGMNRMQEVRSQMPEGAKISTTTVGKWNAVEMTFTTELDWKTMTTRTIVVAAGDYCIAIVLMTDDEAYPQSAAMWTTMRSTIDIDPPINKWLLFGLVGFGALGAMWLLGRVGSRQVNEIPDHEGRWRRHQDGIEDMGAVAAHKPMQTGVRPKVLSAAAPRTGAEDDLGGSAPGRPAPRTMPAPAATDAAVTRPPVKTQSARPGLRSTRPASGRWGE